MQGDVESGSRWTVAGDGRMLVAVSGSEMIRDDLRDGGRRWKDARCSVWVGGDSRRFTGGREEVYSDGGSLAPQEDPPGGILLGARTSKEYAPRSSPLRGQSSSEPLSPERTPPGGLDSFVYLSFPPASGRIDVSIADADVRGNYLVDQLASGSTLYPSAANLRTGGRRETPTE
ncbi:hypothetical protein V490_01332 [Pseudogymnoascus sp. VKM F-3557]|nr:hypothetical protein V490_01332 [Pseudogymnoascus sp. VKM F-3557]